MQMKQMLVLLCTDSCTASWADLTLCLCSVWFFLFVQPRLILSSETRSKHPTVAYQKYSEFTKYSEESSNSFVLMSPTNHISRLHCGRRPSLLTRTQCSHPGVFGLISYIVSKEQEVSRSSA